jgi:hypothetical protein
MEEEKEEVEKDGMCRMRSSGLMCNVESTQQLH